MKKHVKIFFKKKINCGKNVEEIENWTGDKFLSEKLDGRPKKYLVEGRARIIARPFINVRGCIYYA